MIKNMKKSLKIMSYFLALGLVTLISNSGNAYATINNNLPAHVVSKQSYQNVQLDDTTLYKMALQGNLVNNENTQVDVSYQDNNKTQVVKIKKMVSKTVFNDGKTTENYSVTAMLTTGVKEEYQESGSYTVGVTLGFNYEKTDFQQNTCYKATSFYSTPTVLDNAFSLASLYQTITAAGRGFTAGGVQTYINESQYQGTFNNPTVGITKSANTGFVKYLVPGEGSGLGTKVTLGYIRKSTGVLYSYDFNLPLIP
jgi:hypothetical protein